MRPFIVRTLTLAAAMVAATQLTAQAAVRILGTACGFENDKPQMSVTGLPRLGATVTVRYGGPNYTTAPTQRIAWPQLVLGLAPQKLELQPRLPLQPADCFGYVRPDVIIPMAIDPTTNQKFEAQLPLAVPNDRALVGLQVMAQWLTVVDQCGFAGCNTAALLTSNAAELTIG